MKSKQVLCVVPGKVEMVVAHRTPLPAKETVSELGSFLLALSGVGRGPGMVQASGAILSIRGVCGILRFLVCFTVLQQLVFFYFFCRSFLTGLVSSPRAVFSHREAIYFFCWGMEAGGSYSAILVKSLPQLFNTFKKTFKNILSSIFFLARELVQLTWCVITVQ